MNPNCYTRDELFAMNVSVADDTVTIDRTVRFYGPGPFMIGAHTRIDAYTVITSSVAHGLVRFGRHIHIGTHCYLQGSHGLSLDDACFVAAGSAVFTGSEDYVSSPLIGPSIPSDMKYLATAPVHFHLGSGIGSGTIVLPGVTIGRGATVGALSLVDRDIAPYTVAWGVPARSQKKRPQAEIDKALLKLVGRHG